MEEIQIYSTKLEVEEAKKSVFWLDIIRELKAWKEGFDIEMGNIVDDAESKNPSTASVLLHMGDLNGRKKAIDYLLSLPDMFLQLLEDKKDDTEHNRTDGSEVS